MIFKKAGLFFLFLFFTFSLRAQRIITGRLINFHSKEAVSEIPVTVYKGTQFAVSGDRGYFQLTVNPGDSLVISDQDYNPAIIPVPAADVFILYVEKRYVYPVYLSGDASLYKFLQDNIKYPTFANIKSKEEFLLVELAIDTTGDVSGCKILNQVGKDFEKSVLSVFKNIPGKWSSEKQATVLIFPVLFKAGWEDASFEIPKIEIPKGKIMDQIIVYAY